MSTFYITQQGAVVSKTSERLNVTLDKEIIAEIPLMKLSQLVFVGHVSVTPAARNLLMRREIEICYVTQHGGYIGRMEPEISKNAPLRFEQYKAAFEPKRCLALARQFVVGKLANLRTALIQKTGKQRDAPLKRALKQLKDAEKSTKKARRLEGVRAQEGNGSSAYFPAFHYMLKTEEFQFETRVRRPPTDPVNALLSFGYTLLAQRMRSAVNIVGFDPYIGYLHALEYGRPSLALDLIEEFRPVIVDSLVLACLNQGILKKADFQETGEEGIRLTDEACRTFLAQYEQRLNTEFT